MKMFIILIVMVTSQVYAYVKTHVNLYIYYTSIIPQQNC